MDANKLSVVRNPRNAPRLIALIEAHAGPSHIVAYLNASPNSSHEVIPGACHALKLPAWDEAFVRLLEEGFPVRAQNVDGRIVLHSR